MAKNGFKVFDSDMHIMEPPDLWPKYIEEGFRDIAPRGVLSENVRDLRLWFPGDGDPPSARNGAPSQGRNFQRNQELYQDHADRGWGPDCQLEAMDVEGIDVAVLFPTRGLSVLNTFGREPRFAAAIARAYNDWLYDFCKQDPSRLLGAAMVSVHDINDAVQETERSVKDLGFRGVFLRADIVNGKPWHDPYYEPLWDALERMDVPLGFHDASGPSARSRAFEGTDEPFGSNFGLRRVYTQPFRQMIALGSMTGGGVLDRHPNLKVAFLEANASWVPWLLWRLDEDYELEGDIFMKELAMMPSEYFKRQCYVSVEPDEHPAARVIEEIGSDRIVFSTDYPHGDSRYPRATEAFLDLPLSDEVRRQVLWDNCAGFYGVATPVTA